MGNEGVNKIHKESAEEDITEDWSTVRTLKLLNGNELKTELYSVQVSQ